MISARRFAWVLGFAAACSAEPELSVVEQSITPDVSDPEFTGVCGIDVVLPKDALDPDMIRDPMRCSCTLVADGVVLTAAHCLYENILDVYDDTGDPVVCDDDSAGPCIDDIHIAFGNSFSMANRLPITREDILLFRYFDSEAPTTDDVALVHFTGAPGGGAVPVTINDQGLGDLAGGQGERVTLVGYGITGDGLTDFGQRRRVDALITAVGADQISAGSSTETSCDGDDGGPGFYDFDDGRGPVQILINAGIPVSICTETTRRSRVDRYAGFIYTFVDFYNGACKYDGDPGMCETAGCRSPDPDCDECLWQNDPSMCATGCETRDPDCPIGTFPGGACATSDDCERGGRCIAARDDEAFTYCSQPCDLANGDADCLQSMECIDQGGGVGECEYRVPSPGSYQYPCSCASGKSCENDECRSGICEQEICTKECTSDAECGGDPFTCQPSSVADVNVCTGLILSGGGGFCAAGGRTTGGTLGGIAVLLLAALALVFIRPRG
jgi:hypothetical protein